MLRPYQEHGSASESCQENPSGLPHLLLKLRLFSQGCLSQGACNAPRIGCSRPLISGGKGLQGSPVRRPPGKLRLHPVFLRLSLVGTLINYAVHGRKPQGSVPEPILITSTGIVISGVRQWHTAVSEGRSALDCIEYQLNDDEAIQLILTLQQSRGTWNSFTRIQLALQQEPCIQARAHVNQVAGGRDKALTNCQKLS